MSGSIEVENSELRTVRDAMRELNGMVEMLTEGTAGKYVLTKRQKFVAVVVSVEEYARLVDASRGRARSG